MSNRRTRFRAIYLVHAARWIVGLIAFAATVATVAGFAFPSWDAGIHVGGAWIPLGWAAAVIAGGAWIAYRFLMVPLVVSHNDVGIWVELDQPAPESLLVAEIVKWREYLDENRLPVVADLLLTPRQRIRRITEVVRYVGRAVEISMSVIVDRPHLAGAKPGAAINSTTIESIIVPVLMREKGHPNDVLRLHDDQDRRTAQISALGTAAICVIIVERLVESAIIHAGKISDSQAQRLWNRESKFVRELAQSGNSMVDSAGEAIKALELDAKTYGIPNEFLVPVLRAYALLAGSYPVMCLVHLPDEAETDADFPIRIRVERVDMPSYRGSSGWGFAGAVRWIIERGRRFLGVHRARFVYRLANADRAAAYHLTVHAPDGLFVEETTLRWTPPPLAGLPLRGPARKERRELINAELANKNGPVAQLVEASTRRARPYVHVHVRGAHRLAEFDAVTTFREVSPGSVGEALVTSALFAVIISALALARDRFVDPGNIVAILVPLALTAVGATSLWQGVIQTRLPFGGRAAARASSFVTLLLALASVGLVTRPAILALRNSENSWVYEALSGIPGDADTQWSVVVASAIVNVIVMLATWWVAVATEMDLLAKRPKPSRSKRPKRKVTP